MRYLALACDYDGTLATHGSVDKKTIAVLERVLASGRKLLLVTGRELDDLLKVFPETHLFERIVAENGALLYHPESREEKLLAERPLQAFVEALRKRNVSPLSVGRSIVATWHPHETTVIEVIRELGLELQVIFNKGAVMVLPTGVNKGTGLAAALADLGLSPHNVVGVGDAENDHAFLSLCECSVAVANALETLKQRADVTTEGDHGIGVAELIEKLLENDLAKHNSRLRRHEILLGHDPEGQEVRITPHGCRVLVAGPSGSGKSTVVTALLERLVEKRYQFCLVDPEGDFETFGDAVALGDEHHTPSPEEIVRLLEKFENAVLNLLGVPLTDRTAYFPALLARIQELRRQTGRPHWLVLDEAHHLLPATWRPAALTVPQEIGSAIFVTVHPDHMSRAALSAVDIVLAVGASPEETVRTFCAAVDQPIPAGVHIELEKLGVLAWFRTSQRPPLRVRVLPGASERRRHRRKYAQGDIQEKSFYFRGPEGKLNLKAQNLVIFVQLAEGVDDQTWLHHLKRGDYSHWVREAIKDEGLADEIAKLERSDLPTAESRALVKQAIERQYTSAA
jgi:HAD superfamily hydrolase (TIGR01484 family)